VVSIIPFDTEAEAISLANATPTACPARFGAATNRKALRPAKGIQAGVLSVNSNSSVHTEAPFGGYKMSASGRELGMSAIEAVHRDEEHLHRPAVNGAAERPGDTRRDPEARPGREPEHAEFAWPGLAPWVARAGRAWPSPVLRRCSSG